MFNNWFLERRRKEKRNGKEKEPHPKAPNYSICQILYIKYSTMAYHVAVGHRLTKKMWKGKCGAAGLPVMLVLRRQWAGQSV